MLSWLCDMVICSRPTTSRRSQRGPTVQGTAGYYSKRISPDESLMQLLLRSLHIDFHTF